MKSDQLDIISGSRTVHKCTEYAYAQQGDGETLVNIKDSSGDLLYFPHVDSCVALALFVGANQVIGIHAVEEGFGDVPAKYTRATLFADAIRQLPSDANVSGMLVVGGIDDWGKTIKDEVRQSGLPDWVPYMQVDSAKLRKGVDVIVDTKSFTVTVYDFESGIEKKSFQMPALPNVERIFRLD